MKENKSFFYVVATPIGNLEDISLRAIKVLESSDLILAEKPTVSKKIFTKYGIKYNKIISYNSYSGQKEKEIIFDFLKKGKNVSLISDAGTPTISDPGMKIISEIYDFFGERIENSFLEIVPIPGPSALIAALSVSGFSASEFVFYGFPPVKKGRASFFKEISENNKTSIFYESPHRLIKSLKEIEKNCGPDKKIFIARELTKIFEEKKRGKISEIIGYFENNKNKIKGEFVILIEKLKK